MPSDRRLVARVVAVSLLCLTLLSIAAVSVWFFHRHKHAVAAEAALHRDPSYQYGARRERDQLVFKSVPGVARTAEAQCRAAVAVVPADIRPYSAERAFTGCMDEDRALNS